MPRGKRTFFATYSAYIRICLVLLLLANGFVVVHVMSGLKKGGGQSSFARLKLGGERGSLRSLFTAEDVSATLHTLYLNNSVGSGAGPGSGSKFSGEDVEYSFERFTFTRALIYAYHDKSMCATNLDFLVRFGNLEAAPTTLFVVVVNGYKVTVPLPRLRNLVVLRRENSGLDFGAYTAGLNVVEMLAGGKSPLPTQFGFINCGVTGPFLPAHLPKDYDWFGAFANRLVGNIHLVGAYLTCLLPNDLGGHGPRIEGHSFFTDAAGLAVLRKSGVMRPMEDKLDAIINGEYGLAKAMINASMGFDTLLYRYQGVDWLDRRNWDCNGNKFVGRNGGYDGGSIDPFEVIFFKRFWPTLPYRDQAVVRFEESARYMHWRGLWSSGGGGYSENTPPVSPPPETYNPWGPQSGVDAAAQRGEGEGPPLLYSSLLSSLVKGKVISILTHELTLTGAPFVCVELAQILAEAGASVTLIVGNRGGRRTLAELEAQATTMVPNPQFFISHVSDVASSVKWATQADYVIVSTVVPEHGTWLREFRSAAPFHRGLIWWVHEGAAVMASLEDGVLDATLATMRTPGLLDAIVFPSPSAYSWWNRALGQDYPARPRVNMSIPWGIPHWRAESIERAAKDKSGIASLRATNGFLPSDFIFLTLSTFQPIKGHGGIFYAFDIARRKCPRGKSFKLWALGTQYGYFPPNSEWVFKDKDFFIGGPTPNVAEVLAAADAYLSNTQGGGETWGLGTLAALASGKAVLASNAGGSMDQMVHNVTALIHSVPSDGGDGGDYSGEEEAEEFAAHMCEVAKDRALFQRLSSKGKEHARVFLGQEHIENSVARLFDLLK